MKQMEKENYYVLKASAKYLSYSPVENTYHEVKRIEDLKVWDWMDTKEKDSWFGSQPEPLGVYQFVKLTEKQTKKLQIKN